MGALLGVDVEGALDGRDVVGVFDGLRDGDLDGLLDGLDVVGLLDGLPVVGSRVGEMEGAVVGDWVMQTHATRRDVIQISELELWIPGAV